MAERFVIGRVLEISLTFKPISFKSLRISTRDTGE
jgi:hypothetical protein